MVDALLVLFGAAFLASAVWLLRGARVGRTDATLPIHIFDGPDARRHAAWYGAAALVAAAAMLSLAFL